MLHTFGVKRHMQAYKGLIKSLFLLEVWLLDGLKRSRDMTYKSRCGNKKHILLYEYFLFCILSFVTGLFYFCEGWYIWVKWERALWYLFYFINAVIPLIRCNVVRDQSFFFSHFYTTLSVMLPIHVKLRCTIHTCLGSEKLHFCL